jgi:chorismate synthase
VSLRFLTSGESHGPGLTGIIEGIPAGLALCSEDINGELKRRQKGYGRGGRMKIESDRVEIFSGVRWGATTGSPLTLRIDNKDWQNWEKGMSLDKNDEGSIQAVIRPRPGHADLAGALKYNHHDIRNILERSSARETAMRVALGAVAKKLLSEFSISIWSFVAQIGHIKVEKPAYYDIKKLSQEAEASEVRCFDKETTEKMKALIDQAKEKGDSLGGVFEVQATGVPPGLGSHIQWDRRLDGQLAQALMSIQAMKGVEIGEGFTMAGLFGSSAMDEISYNKDTFPHFLRTTNNAGGIEGGMTNGMPVVARVAMKPIPTLRTPLRSVNIITKEPYEAAYERSDTCAVPAASVIGEAMTALVLARAFVDKFGCDSINEVRQNYKSYCNYLKEF